MVTLFRILTVLPTILLIGLTGCTTTHNASESTLSASEQKGHPASADDRCLQPKKERSYVEPCTSSTSRDPNTPIRDVPGSVQIINRDLMDDQKALRIGDTLRNVSGVQGR